MLDLATLAALHEKYREAAALPVADFALGPHRFDFEKQAYLMGVVNLSADSWYRESVVLNAEAAIRRGRVLHEQGAAIIDVGAESTLAHAAQVDEAAQASALVPVVRELASAGICVSVETYHPSVTTACLKAGAKVLNLTGTADCEEIFREVADFDAGVIICFVQGDNVREVGDLDLGARSGRARSTNFSRGRSRRRRTRACRASGSIRASVFITGICRTAARASGTRCRFF